MLRPDDARQWYLRRLLDNRGFALPSVLLMVTILSLIAASVIGLQFFMKQTVLINVAKVKAEYAAESGIMRALEELKSPDDLRDTVVNRTFEFDGSDAQVTFRSWGMFLYVSSRGGSGKFSAARSALIAEHPASFFEKALIFASRSHQLVFTGQAKIQGDVVVGQPGVTVGNLRNYSSPIQIPISGNVDRQQSPELPPLQISHVIGQAEKYNNLLLKNLDVAVADANSVIYSSNVTSFQADSVSDATVNIFLRGPITITGRTLRKNLPLYIVARGDITISEDSQLKGLVAVISSGKIKVEQGAEIEHAILYSNQSIELEHDAAVTAQLIAPSISMGSGAKASYPSILLSTHSGPADSAKQGITLSDNARVEGLVALISSSESTPSENLITLPTQATVVGTMYSTTRIQLDGVVNGTVVTKDFYFYEPPTTYLGWLKSGNIDRSKLPSGYFVPPGFSNDLKLDIMDWL